MSLAVSTLLCILQKIVLRVFCMETCLVAKREINIILCCFHIILHSGKKCNHKNTLHHCIKFNGPPYVHYMVSGVTLYGTIVTLRLMTVI
jgi:hypothetical protein